MATNKPMKETGRQGLTTQVTKYLGYAEMIYGIWWSRNHQTLGNRKGKVDFEIGFHIWSKPSEGMELVSVELKSPKWRGKLNKHQQLEKERIEKAGGEHHVITSIEQLHDIFCARGYVRVELQ